MAKGRQKWAIEGWLRTESLALVLSVFLLMHLTIMEESEQKCICVFLFLTQSPFKAMMKESLPHVTGHFEYALQVT